MYVVRSVRQENTRIMSEILPLNLNAKMLLKTWLNLVISDNNIS